MKLRLLLTVVFALTASCVYAQQDSTRDLNRIRTAIQSFQPRPNSGASPSSISAPAASADPHSLIVRFNVDVTDNVSLDISFSAGLEVSGTAADSGDQPTSVSAIGADGSFYPGFVTPTTGTYYLAVDGSSNPYRLQTCFAVTGPGNVTSTVNESDLTVVMDITQHDVLLPFVSKSPVAGNVAMLDPFYPFNQLGAVSPDNTTAGTSFLLSPNGDYTNFMIPDGLYNFGVFQIAPPFSFAIVPLGPATVSGPTTANFTSSPLTWLTGQVSGLTMIPSNSVFQAIDSATPPSSGACNGPIVALGSGAIDASTGIYSLRLPNGILYSFFAQFPILPASGNQDAGVLFTSGQVMVDGPTTVNINVPTLAPTFTLVGAIKDANSTPASGATIIATSTNITGMPGWSFQRRATSDTAGMYHLDLKSGTNYFLTVYPFNF